MHFLFSIICSVLLATCKKAPEEIAPQSSTVPNYHIVQGVQSFNEEFVPFDPSESDANEMLAAFHDEIEEEDVNSREVSKTLWALEAYLGYFLDNLDYEFDSYEYYEDEFELALDTTYPGDTMVLGEDILAAYNQIMDYVNDELYPDEIYIIDIIYESYSSGILTFKAEMVAGTKGETRPESQVNYLPTGSYEPHYTGACTHLTTSINNSLNINYQRLNCGPNIRYVSNLQKLPTDHINTSCCSGSTLGDKKHLYEKHQFNYCLNAGSTTDDGYSGTANGWLNEALWLVG